MAKEKVIIKYSVTTHKIVVILETDRHNCWNIYQRRKILAARLLWFGMEENTSGYLLCTLGLKSSGQWYTREDSSTEAWRGEVASTPATKNSPCVFRGNNTMVLWSFMHLNIQNIWQLRAQRDGELPGWRRDASLKDRGGWFEIREIPDKWHLVVKTRSEQIRSLMMTIPEAPDQLGFVVLTAAAVHADVVLQHVPHKVEADR